MLSPEHKVCAQRTLAWTVRSWVVCDCPLLALVHCPQWPFPHASQEGFVFHDADGLAWRPALPWRARALEQTRVSLPAPLAGGLGPVVPQAPRVSFLWLLQHTTAADAGANNSTHLFSYCSGGQNCGSGLGSSNQGVRAARLPEAPGENPFPGLLWRLVLPAVLGLWPLPPPQGQQACTALTQPLQPHPPLTPSFRLLLPPPRPLVMALAHLDDPG